MAGLFTNLWAQPLQRAAAGTYDVVVLRVEFQPDTTRFSTGDGTFSDQLWKGVTPKVDPLPHDAAYFNAHLLFLQDYVARVSDGRAQTRTHLLPEVVRVSQKMGAYAPTGKSADSDAERAKLAALVQEAWALADQQSSFSMAGLDPQRTMFMLVHAGAGRDIELTGTTLNKTPEDLPSLFFSPETLARLTAGANIRFKGRTVDHTAIVPETESRLGYDSFSKKNYLVEISINGLLAASFLNYLGVPDLFNTKSGQTAVGSFCVMDGEGIFAYNGLIPPEPSAWVKYYLGWANVQDVPLNTSAGVKTLRAASDPASSDLIRVPISASEFFLIENRFRDPENDGLRLRVWKNGTIQTQTVTNRDLKMSHIDQTDFIGGVVVGADNYDWALPGGMDRAQNERNGGILIWHVDENVLRAGWAANAVNADAALRGVDLEEADGAQDIGVASFACNDNGTSNLYRGSYDDFWYAGNPVNCVINGEAQSVGRYNNRFAPDAVPNSSSNGGVYSGWTLDQFSAAGGTMTLRIEHVPATVFPAASSVNHYVLKSAPNVPATAKGQDARGLWSLEQTGDRAFRWTKNGSAAGSFSIESQIPDYTGAVQVAHRWPMLADVDLDGRLDGVAVYANQLFGFNTAGALLPNFPIAVPSPVVTQPLLVQLSGQQKGTLMVGTQDGLLYGYDLDAGGTLRAGFPLATGGTLRKTPLVKDGLLLAQAENADVVGWTLTALQNTWWGELYHDAAQTNAVTLTTQPVSKPTDALLVESETYNWPNPARNQATNIRFMCSSDCAVQIIVTDFVGKEVTRFEVPQVWGNVATEVVWPAEVATGVYLARIAATANGNTTYRLVRMGIIRS